MKDDNQLDKLIQKASELGDAEAQYELGWIYKLGCSVPQDYTQAIHWFQKAADQAHAEAQYQLGVIYMFGLGVIQDDILAVEWLLKSINGYPAAKNCLAMIAMNGHAEAQYQLGIMYAKGCGVYKDEVTAVRWLQAASSQGHILALKNLRRIRKNGGGVPQKEQYCWVPSKHLTDAGIPPFITRVSGAGSWQPVLKMEQDDE